MNAAFTQADAALAAGDYQQAVTLLQQGLQTAPSDVVAWHNLGSAYLILNQFAEAALAYRRAITLNPTHAPSWPPLARALLHMGDLATADAILSEWLRMRPDADTERLLLARLKLARFENLDAIALLDPLVDRDAPLLEAQWLHTVSCALPMYENEAQITELLDTINQRLEKLRARILSADKAELEEACMLMQLATPLFLPYNGRDVKLAQKLAGDIYHHALTATLGATPLLSAAERKVRNDADDGRIRLAFVSETFFYHSNMKLRRSWLRRIDRTKFRLCIYHVGPNVDNYTREIMAISDEFHHIPQDFDAILAQLRADQPDIIQYTNICLSMLTLRLASLRLAPVQVNTWGHPITSGLPTIDYLITSAPMEPPHAQDYYTEKLVMFPGLSLVPENIFSAQNLPDLDRSAFGLAEDDIVYLCAQSLQKYLPQDDWIYAAIAEQVPHAKFVFIETEELLAISHIFRKRITDPFIARGLNPDMHFKFVPTQNQTGYRSLHKIADITLDSMGWSGANTTFEAIELGGLLITLPGTFLRGRHTSTILGIMQMPELIAKDVDDYIAKAVAFGHDPELRKTLRKKTHDSLPLLYADPGLASALNGFYAQAYTDWAAKN